MNITKERLEEVNILIARYLEFDKFYNVSFTPNSVYLQGRFNKEVYLDLIDDGFEVEEHLDNDYRFVRLLKGDVKVTFDIKGTLEEIVELKKEMGWD